MLSVTFQRWGIRGELPKNTCAPFSPARRRWPRVVGAEDNQPGTSLPGPQQLGLRGGRWLQRSEMGGAYSNLSLHCVINSHILSPFSIQNTQAKLGHQQDSQPSSRRLSSEIPCSSWGCAQLKHQVSQGASWWGATELHRGVA